MRTYKKRKNILRNTRGFMAADFIFSFVLVIGIGIFIFALTFSLATIEVGQYIVWSTARNYAAANEDAIKAEDGANLKFESLIKQFPLLTDAGEGWFELKLNKIGDLANNDADFGMNVGDKLNSLNSQPRTPWTGVSANISLKLFSGLNVPFMGKVASDPTIFTFPIRTFMIRNVSKKECQATMYVNRWEKGVKILEGNQLAPAAFGPNVLGNVDKGWGEDNGC